MSKSYQELKDQLEEILTKLQNEDLDVDKAVELHAEGKKVIKELEVYLEKVSKDIKLK